MHPIVSAEAVKVEQHTQQVKGGITFAVQQDIKQFLLYSSDERAIRDFLREAENTKALKHENVVQFKT
jgi:hypothetical protein